MEHMLQEMSRVLAYLAELSTGDSPFSLWIGRRWIDIWIKAAHPSEVTQRLDPQEIKTKIQMAICYSMN